MGGSMSVHWQTHIAGHHREGLCTLSGMNPDLEVFQCGPSWGESLTVV